MSTVLRANTPERIADRGWRIFATGLSFAVFGIGGTLLGFTLFPVLRLVSWSRATARRRIRYALHLSFRLFVWFMKSLGLLTYEVRNRERLLKPGQLIVANHPTLIDVVFLMSLVPDAGCVVKRGLWRNPFLRWPVVWAGYIPNSDSETLVRECAQSLLAGRTLIVFPEGTRTPPGRPMRLKRGAAQVALAAGADVVPVAIACEPLTLTKHEPWYRVPPVRPHFTLHVFAPVSASVCQRAGEPNSLAARHLTSLMASYFGRGPVTVTSGEALVAPAAVAP